MVNNVETIASVPAIVQGGSDWFRAMGTEKSPGPKIYSISGHVERPGQYEAPLGITLRQLLELAGGMKDGIPLKFWTPGGSSTPLLTAEHLDVPLDFEGAAAAGSMLGTTAVQVFNETVSVPWAVMKWTEFYKHETCGKCTPCREGTYWLVQVLERMVHGQGTEADIDVLLDVCDNILGRSFCALGDGAASPITSAIKYFRQEFLDLIAEQPAVAQPEQLAELTRSPRHDDLTPARSTPRAAPGARGSRPADHRRHRGRRAQGRAADPHLRAARHHRAAVLRPPAARPGRRLPAVPGRGGDGRPADAQAAGQLHHDGGRRHGRARPSTPRRWPTRRSRA